MRAAISSAGFPSDTHLLVDACIARVRAAAHLDDDALLPPLPTLAPRRDVVIFTRSQTATAAAAVPAVAFAASPRSASRPGRWPVVLCAFIAGVAGGVAFLASPAGQRPAVQRVTHAVEVQATSVARATIARLSSAR